MYIFNNRYYLPKTILFWLLFFSNLPILLGQITKHTFAVENCTPKIQELLDTCQKYQSNEPVKVFKYAEEALNLAQTIDCKPATYQATVYLGLALSDLGDYEPAYKYYLQALNIQEKFLHNNQHIATVLNHIATIYRYQKNPQKVLYYLAKALKLAILANDSLTLATTYNQMGRAYNLEKKWNLALSYHQKALAIRLAIRDTTGIIISYNNVGYILSKELYHEQALLYYQKSLQLNTMKPNKEMRAGTLDNIGDVYMKLGKYAKALQYFAEGLQIARQIKSKTRILESYESLSQFYDIQRQYEKAYFFQKQYLQLKDSIFSMHQNEQMARMSAIYSFEQQRKEMEILKMEKKVQEKEIDAQKSIMQRQSFTIAVACFALVMLILVAYILYRYNQNKNIANQELKQLNSEITTQRQAMLVQAEELSEANEEILQLNESLEKTVQERTASLEATYQELDTFLYRTSHDFRRPLTALLGLSQIAHLTLTDAEALFLFDKIKETSLEMDKMIHKLQILSEINLNKEEEKQVIDFEEIRNYLFQKFAILLQDKQIDWKYTVNVAEKYYSRTFFIQNILENLLENSIYFASNSNPMIAIAITEIDKMICLEVTDNGQGIADEVKSKIFAMYFRGNENSKGNGLGLYVVKNIVANMEGTISFESNLYKGSVFRIFLPKNSSLLAEIF